MITDGMRLMLWRNLRLRLYHYVITIIEILLPIVVFNQGLVFYHLLVHNSQSKNATVFPTVTEFDLNYVFRHSFVTIFYTPKNAFTDNIIALVNQTIRANEILSIKNEAELELRFANETFIGEHRTKFKWAAFGIVFTKPYGPGSSTFKYKIRTPVFLLPKDTRQLYSDVYSPPGDAEGMYILEYSYPKREVPFITLTSQRVTNHYFKSNHEYTSDIKHVSYTYITQYNSRG